MSSRSNAASFSGGYALSVVIRTPAASMQIWLVDGIVSGNAGNPGGADGSRIVTSVNMGLDNCSQATFRNLCCQ